MKTAEAVDRAMIRELLADENGGIPAELLTHIYEQKLFRLFIPKQLGGLELTLPDALQVLRTCAEVDGTYGWAVQIGAGGGYFCSFLDPEIQDRFVTQPEFVIAGSGYPGATATRKNGGYQISAGKWRYCSGSQYATLYTANCELDGAIKAFSFLPGEVEIIADWDAYGLKATSSNSMHTAPLFLPAKRAFDLAQVSRDYGYVLHRYPFTDFAAVVLSATLSGCFLHLLEETEKIARKRSIPALLALAEKNRQTALERWEKLTMLVVQAWKKAVQNTLAADDELLQNIRRQVHDSTAFFFLEAATAYYRCGMEASYEHEPFNRVWRDFTTLCQHQMIKEDFV